MTNKTFNALYVACKAGYDGGLRQTFIIEVYQVEETFTTSSYLTPMTVVEIIFQGKYYDDFLRLGGDGGVGTGYQDMTSYQDLVSHPIKRTEVIGQPRFEVKDLPTGTGFAVVVYAVNEKVSFHLEKKPT